MDSTKIVTAVHKNPNVATSANDVFAIVMLFHCPAVCSKDMNSTVVLVAFTSRQSSLKATNKAA